jgi:urease accessory protein
MRYCFAIVGKLRTMTRLTPVGQTSHRPRTIKRVIAYSPTMPGNQPPYIMLTVNKLLPQGQGLAAVLLRRAASVELDWDLRQKSRFEASDSQGRQIGVFLPRGTVVRGGDVLVAEDGSLIRVVAAPQAVLTVRACTQHGSPFDLLRAAYHLGNRHVQLELQPDHLKLEPDHVLADMLRQMHLIVSEENSAFEPEGGAYASGGHGHGHGGHDHHDHGGHGHAGHDHGDHAGCSHDHAHSHTHEPAVAAPARPRAIAIPVLAAQPHVHGPGCSHGHHDHGHAQGHAHDDHGHDHAPVQADVSAHGHSRAHGHDHADSPLAAPTHRGHSGLHEH